MKKAKQLMKSGDVRGAAEELKAILAARPDDAEALMLFGTCCHLLGDDETFKKIHDRLAPQMATVSDRGTRSLWRRYHRLWMSLIAGGLVLAGLGATVLYFGRTANRQVNAATNAMAAYGGTKYYGPEKEGQDQTNRHVDRVDRWPSQKRR